MAEWPPDKAGRRIGFISITLSVTSVAFSRVDDVTAAKIVCTDIRICCWNSFNINSSKSSYDSAYRRMQSHIIATKDVLHREVFLFLVAVIILTSGGLARLPACPMASGPP
ncbi:hypothetical protein AVEN_159800-1 [Araneus ventricosus]|uniref:Uncharacterized protein n=1 Tax=Araneus ventricosus TaxID=182803 RepID=A0A4Y2KIC9_ARAVE|nr:hypothetical protein AVEN_159800-1 [Araneus ventricosus]